MNPPNQTPDDFSRFPFPHFTLTPPLPNPTSNPNFHPIPILNPNVAPPLNDHLIFFPTPKKRRRGRPQRSGATSAYQFLNFTFVPELPQRKLDGIKRLGFGLLNKVGMLFPYVFWGTDFDTFGLLSNDPSRRGEFFLFYSYATVSGGPLLLALVAGEAAHRFETLPPIDVVAQVLQILKV